MYDLGHLLRSGEREKVTDLITGSLATEYTEPIYTAEGYLAAGNNLDSRRFFALWGQQERRHWQVLEICLEDSGLMTSDQIAAYRHECAEAEPWSFEVQTGHPEYDIVWANAYAVFQEGQTKLTYTGIKRIVWGQYDSPMDPSGRRKLYPGLCGVLGLIAAEEGAHEAYYIRMMRLYLRFWPERALEAIAGVIKGYQMPVVFIPNGRQFLRAVVWAELYSAKWVLESVQNHGIKSLGLKNRKAWRAALRNFGKLLDREDAVVQVQGQEIEHLPAGCKVYDLSTAGEFTMIETAA